MLRQVGGAFLGELCGDLWGVLAMVLGDGRGDGGRRRGLECVRGRVSYARRDGLWGVCVGCDEGAECWTQVASNATYCTKAITPAVGACVYWGFRQIRRVRKCADFAKLVEPDDLLERSVKLSETGFSVEHDFLSRGFQRACRWSWLVRYDPRSTDLYELTKLKLGHSPLILLLGLEAVVVFRLRKVTGKVEVSEHKLELLVRNLMQLSGGSAIHG